MLASRFLLLGFCFEMGVCQQATIATVASMRRLTLRRRLKTANSRRAQNEAKSQARRFSGSHRRLMLNLFSICSRATLGLDTKEQPSVTCTSGSWPATKARVRLPVHWAALGFLGRQRAPLCVCARAVHSGAARRARRRQNQTDKINFRVFDPRTCITQRNATQRNTTQRNASQSNVQNVVGGQKLNLQSTFCRRCMSPIATRSDRVKSSRVNSSRVERRPHKPTGSGSGKRNARRSKLGARQAAVGA